MATRHNTEEMIRRFGDSIALRIRNTKPETPGQPTNYERAEFARLALDLFSLAVYGDPEGEDVQTRVKDLATDLCHLLQQDADLDPLEVGGVMDSAYQMYREEESEDI